MTNAATSAPTYTATILTLAPTSPAALRLQIRATEAAMDRESNPRRLQLLQERLDHLCAWLGTQVDDA